MIATSSLVPYLGLSDSRWRAAFAVAPSVLDLEPAARVRLPPWRGLASFGQTVLDILRRELQLIMRQSSVTVTGIDASHLADRNRLITLDLPGSRGDRFTPGPHEKGATP